MNEKWIYNTNEKLYPKEGHTAVPIRCEFPAVAYAQYNNDYCKKTIAILKVLVLSALLILLGWTCIILCTNYHLRSTFLVDNQTARAYCAEFSKAAVKSSVHLDSRENAASNIPSEDTLSVHPYYDHYNRNNFQKTSEYKIKARIARKAEGNKEEEFKKWLQSLDTKDLFSNINANPRFKADLKRFVDNPEDADDDVQKLFTQVLTKYRNTVETYVKDLVINAFDDVDANFKEFNSTAKSENNKRDSEKDSN